MDWLVTPDSDEEVDGHMASTITAQQVSSVTAQQVA